MKKFCLFFMLIFLTGVVRSQKIIQIIGRPGEIGIWTADYAFGSYNYSACEFVYTEAEVGGGGNFTSAGNAINRIAFNTSNVGDSFANANILRSVRIYFKDVPAATTEFFDGKRYGDVKTGYTQVFDGSLTIADTGWTELRLSNPYARTPGTNLQVLIERTSGREHIGKAWHCAPGNNLRFSANTCRNYEGRLALSDDTYLNINNYRPAIQLIHRFNNDAKASVIYTLGKIPAIHGSPHTISANISNEGLAILKSVRVTLNVTGANTFTDTKTILLLPSSGNATVAFAPFTPRTEGKNTVTVTVSTPDDFTDNNEVSLIQYVNKDTWSYSYSGEFIGNGVMGTADESYDIVSKNSSSGPAAISQVAFQLFSGFSSGTNNNYFKIGIWDATGPDGKPGTLLWESDSIKNGVKGLNVIPVNPKLNIRAGNFYVGVRKIVRGDLHLGVQLEGPPRSSTFYITKPSGSTNWRGIPQPYRILIEPKLYQVIQ